MIKISKDKVLLLQQLMIEETGGSAGLRDMNLLDSAVENIYQTFDGIELYKTKEEKAAMLAFSLINNHAFVDGNKRIGIFEINGISLNCTNEELVELGLGVAGSVLKYEQILLWIKEHKLSTALPAQEERD